MFKLSFFDGGVKGPRHVFFNHVLCYLYYDYEKYPLSPLKPRGLALLSWYVPYNWGSGNSVHRSFTWKCYKKCTTENVISYGRLTISTIWQKYIVVISYGYLTNSPVQHNNSILKSHENIVYEISFVLKYTFTKPCGCHHPHEMTVYLWYTFESLSHPYDLATLYLYIAEISYGQLTSSPVWHKGTVTRNGFPHYRLCVRVITSHRWISCVELWGFLCCQAEQAQLNKQSSYQYFQTRCHACDVIVIK